MNTGGDEFFENGAIFDAFFSDTNPSAGYSLPKELLDAIPYMLWVKDRSGRFKFANIAFSKATGQSYKFILGNTDFEVWGTELAEGYVKDDQEVIRSGCRKSVEEKIRDADGVKWFETLKAPIFNKMGEVVGVIGISREIQNMSAGAENFPEAESTDRFAIEKERWITFNDGAETDPELLNRLNRLYCGLWEDCSRGNRIDDVRDLARQLKELSMDV